MAPLLLLGAAVGGAAMYFLDPDQGRRRRALVRDRAVSTTTHAKHFVEEGARDLKNRGSALTGRARSLLGRKDATDPVLVERVRSRMGRYTAHPGAIEVAANQGQVTLTGSILAHEHRDLVDGISEVPGVTDILDQFTVYETAQGISELQGSPRARRGEVRGDWAPGTRLVSGAAGTTLTLYALSRSNRLAGFVALATGVALLARAVTNKPLGSIAEIELEHAPEVRETDRIDAPLEEEPSGPASRDAAAPRPGDSTVVTS